MTARAGRLPLRRIVLPLQLLVLAAIGLVLPLSPQSVAAAAVLNVQLSTATATPTGAMSMTNVAQVARGGSDCATPTNAGICATLFTASSTGLLPGGDGAFNAVTITYAGGVKTGDFRLSAANYAPRAAGSSALCTAPASAIDSDNPGTRIEIQILQGTQVIFPVNGSDTYGTVQTFARTFNGPATGLTLRGGTNGSGQPGQWSKGNTSTFTIKLRLGVTATNAYQGCRTALDFVWSAAQ